MSRRSVIAIAVWSVLGCDLLAVGCGQSTATDSPPTPGSDAAAADGATADASAPLPLSVSASSATVYVAARARLSAIAEGGPAEGSFAWAWTVTAVPSGSQIYTSSIVNSAQPNASFVPDVAGTYGVRITLSKGSATSMRDIKVVAVDAPVFFVAKNHLSVPSNRAEFDGDGGTVLVPSQSWVASGAQIMVTSASGGAVQAVTDPYAPRPFDPDAGQDAASWDYGVGVIPEKMASQGSDWWEGPAGTESRLAYVAAGRKGGNAPAEPGGGATIPASSFLSLATAAQNSSVRRTLVSQKGETLFQPQFSPDGRRIAYVTDLTTGTRLATIGFDGTDPHPELAPFFAKDGGTAVPKERLLYYSAPGVAFLAEQPVRPQWLDATHVAWLQDKEHGLLGGSPYGWQIVSVADATGSPTPELYMRCNPYGLIRPTAVNDAGKSTCDAPGEFCSDNSCCNAAEGMQCLPSSAGGSRCSLVTRNLDAGGTVAGGEWRAAGIPTQFAFLADGSVLVSIPTRSGTGNLDSVRPYSSSLIILRPDPVTKECSLVRVVKESQVFLTPDEADAGQYDYSYAPGEGDLEISRSSFIGDFSLSPDRSQVAFLVHSEQTDPDPDPPSRTVRPRVFVAGIDPPSDPVAITDKRILNGPRWIAGGALLVTSTTEAVDGGVLPETQVVVLHPDGKEARVLVGTTDAGTVPLGIGNGFFDRGYYMHCTTTLVGAHSATPFWQWATGVAVAFAAIRRRTRRTIR